LWTVGCDFDVLIKTPFQLEKYVTRIGRWTATQNRHEKLGKIFESLR
jgi:hypothetical protein